MYYQSLILLYTQSQLLVGLILVRKLPWGFSISLFDHRSLFPGILYIFVFCPLEKCCCINFSLLLFDSKTSLSHSPSSILYLFAQLPFTPPDVQTPCGIQWLYPPPPNTLSICPSPTSPSRPISITVPLRNWLRSTTEKANRTCWYFLKLKWLTCRDVA